MFTSVRKLSSLLIIILFSILVSLSACISNGEVKFGIYLVENGELVLSEHHIEKYHWDTHTIILNDEGIEKWNSFITYKDIPKLADTLYNKDFILRVKGNEIYNGKFYSMLSSSSYDGVVILDAIMKLDGERNNIRINFGYGPHIDYEDDPRNSLDVFDCLKETGLIE